jgi:hypothetical protein
MRRQDIDYLTLVEAEIFSAEIKRARREQL